jgi:hypothetical protein
METSELTVFFRPFILIQLMVVTFLLLSPVTKVQADNTNWYNSNWLYRKPIIVNNTKSTNTLTDYQIQVSLTYNLNMQKDFNDIRFTDSDGITLIDHWLETYATSASATFWVKVPSIPSSSTKIIFYYYGNPETSSVSNGLKTFEISGFDDFESYNMGLLTPQPLASNPWTEYENNPVLGVTAKDGFQSVVKDGDTYHMYYSWGDIRHATSSDGINWTIDTKNNPVLTNAGVPRVWIENSTWYMLYRADKPSRIHLATSNNGVKWTKYKNNPIFEETVSWSGGVEPNGVIKVGSIYYMFYSDWNDSYRKTGVATSNDLINWTKDVNNPIFTGGRFCGCPFKYGNYYYYLVPHYTWDTDYSNIELYRDTNPTFYLESREFVKIAIPFGSKGTWNCKDQDTPSVLTDDIHCDSFNLTNNQLWVYFAGSPDSKAFSTGLVIEPNIAIALEKVSELPSWDGIIDTIRIVDNPAYQGSRAIDISDPSTTTTSTLYTNSFDPKTTGVVGAWMQRDNIRGKTSDNFEIYLYSGDKISALTGFGETYFVYWDGSYHNTTTKYLANTWYLMTLEFSANKYNFVVYDTNLKEIVRINNISRDSGAIDKIAFYTSASFSGNGYVDNFRIRKYSSPEPLAFLVPDLYPEKMGNSEWMMPIKIITNKETKDLSFGVKAEASDGFDQYIDIPDIDMNSLRFEASFVIEDSIMNHLTRDMRGISKIVDWKIELDDQNEDIELLWDASSLPIDKDLVLQMCASELDMRVWNRMKVPSGKHVIFIMLKDRVPTKTELFQNYPNPFSTNTWIPYQLSESGEIFINIYDVSGHLVRRLYMGRRDVGVYVSEEKAGYWDGRNETGEKVSSGVYFCQMQSNKFSKFMKLVMIR